MENLGKDRTWLVKSSGKILGPFTQQEVNQLLLSRKISIVDEIRQASRRWLFIREFKEFEAVILKLRHEEAQYLDDETTTDINLAALDGKVEKPLDDDKTPLPQMDFDNSKAFEAKPQVPEVKSQEQRAPTEGPVRSYALPSAKPQSLWTGSSRLAGFLWVTFLVVLLAGGWIFYHEKSFSPKSFSTEDYLKLARSSRSLGDFANALDFYKKAQGQAELDLNSKVQMAFLLLEVGSQTTEARRLAEEVLAKAPAKERLAVDAKIVQGLAFLKERNFAKADEDFKGILSERSDIFGARINLAMSALLNSNYAQALQEIFQAQQLGLHEPEIYFAKALATLSLAEQTKNPTHLRDVRDDLDRLNSRTQEYRLEALLMKAVLSEKENHREETIPLVRQMLDEDLFLTRDFVHSLAIDRQVVTWKNLGAQCDYLLQQLPASEISKGLAVLCLFQKGDHGLANKAVEDALKEYPTDSHLLALKATILFALGRESEARQIANLVIDKSNLAERILGSICQANGESSCAEDSWNRLSVRKPGDLRALAGLAQVQLNQSHRERALDLVNRGLVIAPNFRPFLVLQEKLDEP